MDPQGHARAPNGDGAQDGTVRFREGRLARGVGITAKGPSKSSAAIQHERLPDDGAVKEMRAFWKERLAALAELVKG
jgi:hypothetical protein